MVNTIKVLLFSVLLPASLGCSGVHAAKNCTSDRRSAVCRDETVKENIQKTCDLIESQGRGAIPEIAEMRYDCCGEPNYVWITDLSPRMILHPIKSGLNGKALGGETDPLGPNVFLEAVRLTEAHPEGIWIDYLWTRFGQAEATPKKAWMKRCKVGTTGQFWILGSGTWK